MTEITALLTTALAGRYAIERELGRGGMATVYLARDLKHDRLVAVKVLHPELAATLGAERFLREVRISARLEHPHILTLIDSGEAGGFLYYVMPYVEGESLRERMEREKQLPLEDALQITKEVAGALSHAHSHDVVHRDIKPENILLSGGEAVVADFGIARAIDAAGAEKLTETGLAVGTPAYMSPEQAMADADVDGRSDLYSLGCVLYEMLAGHAPFTGSTAQEILARHTTDPVPSLRAARAAVPEAVERALVQALAKVPADRFATAQQFAEALRAAISGEAPVARPTRKRRWRIVALVAVLLPLLLVAAAYALVPASTRATVITLLTREDATLDPRRIVVAPLDNKTGDPSFDALGDMAADWIAQGLLQTAEFEVVDARTAFVTARIAQRIPRLLRNGDMAIALAEETGAGIAVSGDIYRIADSLQVRVRITDAVSKKLVQALEPIAESVDAPSELVAALGRRVVIALALAADTTVIGGGVGRPPSYDAYKAASRGWERWFSQDYEEFFEHTDRAVAIDSTYIAPLLMQAFALLDRFLWNEAEPVVSRLERDRDRLTPGERLVLEVFRADLRGDLPGRLRAAQEMLRYFPGSAEAPLLVAQAAMRVNRPGDALEALARTDPRRGLNLVSSIYWFWRCAAFHRLREHERELDAARRSRRQFPADERSRHNLVVALAALGRVAELETVLEQGAPAAPPSRYLRRSVRHVPHWLSLLAVRELRWHGHEPAAERLLSRLRADLDERAVDTARAVIHYVHGELLYEARRWEDARAVFSSLAAEDSTHVAARGYLGVIAARLGDQALARRTSAELGASRRRYLLGQNTFWRAHIAAVLGNREEAVRLLRSASAEGEPYRYGRRNGETVHGHPDFASLRDYPPFQQLMAPKE